jgi:hemolysin III
MGTAVGIARGADGGGRGIGVETAGPGGANAPIPRLRGLLHAGAFPAAAVAGLMLTALAPTRSARLAAAVYSLTCMAMFGASACYHRSPLGSRRRPVVAYTPLAMLALHGWVRLAVLAVIWTGTTVGAVVRLSWRPGWQPPPRWLITSLFIALGWVAVLVLPQLLHGTGVLALALVVAGGLLYSAGAVVYARKRPNPSPRWFGFHEVFHAMTIAAYLTQYAAVSLVVYRAG